MEKNVKLDKEYLSREKLKVNFDYNEDHIKVNTESTSYFYIFKTERLYQKDLLEKYTYVLRKSKELGLQIKYTKHIKRSILEGWKEYEKEYREYDEIYNNLLKEMPKLEERGIHMGTSDDYYLDNLIRYSWKINEFFYVGKPIFYFRSIMNSLSKVEEEIKGAERSNQKLSRYQINL